MILRRRRGQDFADAGPRRVPGGCLCPACWPRSYPPEREQVVTVRLSAVEALYAATFGPPPAHVSASAPPARP